MFAEPECEFTGMGALLSQLIHKKGQMLYTGKCSALTKKKKKKPASLNPVLTGASSTNSHLFIKVKLEADEFAGCVI